MRGKQSKEEKDAKIKSIADQSNSKQYGNSQFVGKPLGEIRSLKSPRLFNFILRIWNLDWSKSSTKDRRFKYKGRIDANRAVSSNDRARNHKNPVIYHMVLRKRIICHKK